MAAFSEENIKTRSLEEIKEFYIKQKLVLEENDPRTKRGSWSTRAINICRGEIARRGLDVREFFGSVDAGMGGGAMPNFAPGNGLTAAVATPPQRRVGIVIDLTLREAHTYITEMKDLQLKEDHPLYELLMELSELYEKKIDELSGGN